jgi:hypothetical protein
MEVIFKMNLYIKFWVGILAIIISIILMIFIHKILWGLVLIILGFILNFTCVFSNGFKMPVKYFPFKTRTNHTRMTKKTRLSFLGDIFLFKIPSLKIPNNYVIAFSIGDVIILIGVILNFFI